MSFFFGTFEMQCGLITTGAALLHHRGKLAGDEMAKDQIAVFVCDLRVVERKGRKV